MKKILLLISLVCTGQVNAQCTIAVNTATICTGQQTATLTATGANSYSWTPSTGLSSTSGSVVTASPTVTTSYTITGVAGSCTTTATSTVTVNPLPIINATSNQPICAGATLFLNCSSGISWNWVGPIAYTSTSQNPIIANVTLGMSGTYTVSATDANGCIGTAVTTVTIMPLPLIAISPKTASGCYPLCVNFSNTSSATGTCFWDLGDGGASFSCNPNHCYTISGPDTTYKAVLTLTDNNGCVNTDTATINVYAIPFVTVSSFTNCAGVADTLIPNCGTSGTQYYWSPPPFYSTTIGDTVIVNPTSTTIYKVVAISPYGCQDSTTSTITINCADIFNISNNIKFSIYPNPTSDQFYIETNSTDKLNVDLYDVKGRHVFSANVSDKSNINVTTLDEGVYTLAIKTVDSVINKKLIILR